MLLCFSLIQLFATPWTVACQVSLSMEFSRQEHWSGLPFPTPGGHPNLGVKPVSVASPALAGGLYTTGTSWKALSSISFLHTFSFPQFAALKNLNPFFFFFCLWWCHFSKKLLFFFQMLYKPEVLAPFLSFSSVKVKVLVTPLCSTLCDPMDSSPPGSSVHGIL